MRPLRSILSASALVGLLLPVAAHAQEWPKPLYSGPQDFLDAETLQLKAKSEVSGFDVNVGPYTAQVVSYPGQPLISVYCVDFLHGVAQDQVWDVNVTKLSGGDVSNTRLGIAGDDNALARYKKAAWLASQFAANQDTWSWRRLSSAIWTTVIAGDDPGFTYYEGYGDWLTKADAAEAGGYMGFNFDYWQVLTDVTADDLGNVAVIDQLGAQEYLVYVTPEPETIIMLMSGMIVLLVVWRRGGIA